MALSPRFETALNSSPTTAPKTAPPTNSSAISFVKKQKQQKTIPLTDQLNPFNSFSRVSKVWGSIEAKIRIFLRYLGSGNGASKLENFELGGMRMVSWLHDRIIFLIFFFDSVSVCKCFQSFFVKEERTVKINLSMRLTSWTINIKQSFRHAKKKLGV